MKQFDVGLVEIRKRNRLPHLVADRTIYFVTWNLKDAIPGHVRDNLRREYEFELRRIHMMRGSVTAADRAQLELAVRRRIERLLDDGYGECILRDVRCAAVVADSLEHFDRDRYRLAAWSVMPNHVHTIFSSNAEHPIDEVVGAWKGYTSKQINKVLGRTGSVWQEDYFDRSIRNETRFRRLVAYVLNNPSHAGLTDWGFVRMYPEAIAEMV